MARNDRMFEAARANIARFGVHASYIQPDDASGLAFTYTTGLTSYGEHPELIYSGAGGMDEHAWIVNNFAFRVRDGVQRFEEPQIITDFGNGYAAVLWWVEDSSRDLTLANKMYRKAGGPPLKALQIAMQDADHRFFWEEGYSMSTPEMFGAIGDPEALPTRELVPHDPPLDHEH